ncbi:ATP-binding protein [Peredibacter sp. HCB2-198]|uniref:sensor histidine kinase n=1 Tax=Peredibacter sp. HCB2-198 TaxID=3383025 RepID=UPI0038B55045
MIKNPRLKHLSHAGEMGYRIATFDWSKTSLGDSEHWPQSLVTTISMMVENKFAMYLVWGDELIQFYNDRYIEILGSKHPEALGHRSEKTWSEIWSTIHPLFEKAMSGESVMFENMPLMVNLNGVMTERFYTFCYSPIRLEDGTVGGVLDTVTDNTAEVYSKVALEQNESKYRTYLEDSPYAFMFIEHDWTIKYLNPTALTLGELPYEDVVGQSLWKVFPGLEKGPFGLAYRKAMATRERVPIEGFYPDNDKWYRALAYPLQNGIAVTFRDFTNEKRLEIDLSTAIKSRDEFLSVASHELKTPLTAMKLQAQIIQRDIERDNPRVFQKEKIARFYDQTFKQVSRLNRLVDDMLDVSRIQSGKLHFRKEPTDLRELLKEVLERMDSYFRNSESGVPEVDFVGENFQGKWDSFRIEQVMNNLFTNAFRYGNGRPIRVILEATQEHIIFSVIDQGQGINPKDQKIIFEQFERGSEGAIEGLGLGLYIAKRIVEGHDGIISLKSVEGEGSTFTVILPK